ncbi:hypothetical protein GGF43_006528, partial [Coemansia sp. RSA 2618]
MGNTQSSEGDGGNRRQSGHHGTASDGQSGSQSGGGGLTHRLSRRAKPASAGVPMPTIQTPPGSSAAQRGNSRRRGPGVGPVDMLSPVVGSPLPDSSMMPGQTGLLGRNISQRAAAHAMPETIPQTLPNQSGLAQMMAARMITGEEGGRSPLSGISDDRIRWMADGVTGTSQPESSGRVGMLDDDDEDMAKAQKT